MKFQILIDNTKKLDNICESEHGFSIYFNNNGYNFLVDTGKSSLFSENANLLNINIQNIDFLIISHAHIDHGGGLETFLKINNKAKIIISNYSKNLKCFSYSGNKRHEISINQEIIQKNISRFIFIDNYYEIIPNICIIGNFQSKYYKPESNNLLKIYNGKEDLQDDFKHEIAVVIKDSNTIISPCSHNGICNIIENSEISIKDFKCKNFIGGLHIPNSENSEYQTNRLIDDLINNNYLVNIFTGHCTGDIAKKVLEKNNKIRCHFFYSGENFEI